MATINITYVIHRFTMAVWTIHPYALLRTDAQFEEYIETYYFPNASTATIEQVMKYYPSDPPEGSPFDTGYLNMLTPQFKRLAALEGDLGYQAMRRFLLENRSGKQSIWTYRTLFH